VVFQATETELILVDSIRISMGLSKRLHVPAPVSLESFKIGFL
jgi:hypothetical protein